MRCEQFEQRLHRLLDRRETPSEDSRLNRHAERCAQCRETLAACGRMVDGLNLMELPVPGDDFPLRVIRRTQVARPSLAASRRFHGAWAAIAVTLALALLRPVRLAQDRAESPAASAPMVARMTQPSTSRTIEAGTDPTNPKAPARNCLAILARPRSAAAARPVAQLDSVLVRPLEPRGRLVGMA